MNLWIAELATLTSGTEGKMGLRELKKLKVMVKADLGAAPGAYG